MLFSCREAIPILNLLNCKHQAFIMNCLKVGSPGLVNIKHHREPVVLWSSSSMKALLWLQNRDKDRACQYLVFLHISEDIFLLCVSDHPLMFWWLKLPNAGVGFP